MIALLLALMISQNSPAPVNIIIKNPSFEDVVPVQYQRACGAYTYMVPPEWTSATPQAAIIVPINPRPCDFSNPPDGKQFLMIQNGSVSQDLGDIYTLLPHDANGNVIGVFNLHFWVASYFYWYAGQATASLSITKSDGTKWTLCSLTVTPSGDFTDVPLICPSQKHGGKLTLTLAGTGYESLFDNVSLTFTPSN